MERCAVRVKPCPMLCILKAVLFTVIVVFMLFLPLGDPHIACQSASSHNTRRAMCYLCEGYFLATRATDKMMEALDFISCVILDFLYDAKLKFYTLLRQLDKEDLCDSLCCMSDDDLNTEESKGTRCSTCKCARKKCTRKPRTVCRYAQL